MQPDNTAATDEGLARFARNTPDEPYEDVAAKHQFHYRLCGCLGDSAECCDKECICHVLD